MRALERMPQEQTPVRVEIERLGVRFKTFMMLRKNVVAVSRPMGFKGEVPVGTTIRLRVPGRSRRDLRLEVVNADYRLPTGRAFFICAMPRRWAPKSARSAERYNTGRITNLELVLCSEKEMPTDPASIPRTHDEWVQRRAEMKTKRKSKRS